MEQTPLDLLSEDDRKELERLLSIIHSETLGTAAKIEEVSRILSRHGLLIQAPSTERTWTATELADELQVSAHSIGRLASKHGLRSSEYGEWRLTKAPNNKQIEQFCYNATGRSRVLELMEPANGKNDPADRMGKENFPDASL